MTTLHRHVLLDHIAIIREMDGGSDRGSGGMDVNGLDSMIALGSNNNNSGGGVMEGDANGGGKTKRANASIEIDAFQLISLDPVLGNMTLRYPDTLLELLEDSTVQARQVLRRRIEVALEEALSRMKEEKEQATTESRGDDSGEKEATIKMEAREKEMDNMTQMLQALKHSRMWYEPRPLHARLVHLPPHMQFCKPTLSSISSADVGTVVQISGTCVRTGPVRMMETTRTYQCLGKGCGHKFAVQADFGTTNNALPAPIICPKSQEYDSGFNCNSTAFAIVPNASQHADYQEIKVQESASALTRVGSVPRSILIKLSDDLVDKCNPGDEVVVVGSLHAEWQSGTSSFGANLEIMVGISMRAHSVRVINVDEEGGSSFAPSSTLADLGAMGGNRVGALASTSGNLREKFRREFDAFWSEEGAKRRPIATRDYILRAVCPKLYGMHAVKLGLLLVMIGGAAVTDGGFPDVEDVDDVLPTNGGPKKSEESDEKAGPVAFDFGGGGNENNMNGYAKMQQSTKSNSKKQSKKSEKAVRSKRRIQSHILLIGDPGTGKSQFLRFAAALSPRSVLTTGTGSSTAGLTCAAVRDSSAGSNGNEFSLEAGALALADKGVCCIDEFGCMSKEDRTSIHEAMEQQTISVAKAGIICKLNARATVVAVMNPIGGIYDETQSLERNSRLGSALLSRFDLIFVMMDQAECTRDENIADFLLQQSIIPGSGYDRPLEIENNFNDDNANGHWSMEKLRAYIATVRDKFHPTLTQEASQLLENHYSLCRQSKTEKSLPITVRFLESLIRLSQAHARLMYRDTVLVEDAAAVILLMECTATAYQNQIDFPSDDFIFKNPIDTAFPPYDSADSEFEQEIQLLFERYHNVSPNEVVNGYHEEDRFNGGYHEPSRRESRFQSWDDVGQYGQQSQSYPCAERNKYGSQQRDQWGRTMLSQAVSPKTTTVCQSTVRKVMDTLANAPNNSTPSSSGCNSSQQSGGGMDPVNVRSQHTPRQEQVQIRNTQQSHGEYNEGLQHDTNTIQQYYGNGMSMTQQSGGFIREDNVHQQVGNNVDFSALSASGKSSSRPPYSSGSLSQKSASNGTSRSGEREKSKKRRTAD